MNSKLNLITMTARDWLDVAIFVFGGLLSVLGTLLMLRAHRTDKDIQQLYAMHHSDEDELNKLKLKVAESYPSKADIKEMFTEFKEYLDERFNNVEQIARYSSSSKFGDRHER